MKSRRRTRSIISESVQINAQRLGVGTQPLFLDGLQGSGGDAKTDPALAFCPPELPVLQIGLLQLLGADVGMAHSHAVVGASSCELAHPRHDVVLLLEVVLD